LTAFRDADLPAEARDDAMVQQPDFPCQLAPRLILRVYDSLDAVEHHWRRFEQVADCTPFQTFDWLAAWHRQVGMRDGVRPVIAVGSFSDGETAFLLPLAVEPMHRARRLCWLGQDLSDYNAPLLARDFSQRVTPDRFLAVWRELGERMQCDPILRHDWIELEKMPETVGAQRNPFTYLAVTANASGAHFTTLGTDWQEFYSAKRSSATRRRDRAKRKHMSEFGEIRFVTSTDPEDARRTLETLMKQKGRLLAHKGIADIFAPPGYREFFLDIASNPKTRHLVHISRIEIGATCAAANLGVMFNGCYYHVLASYDDSEVARYGPGALHLRELLAHAIRLGLRRFDFTIGDEPYKREWSDTDLTLWDYSTAVTWRGWAATCSSIVHHRIKRLIKQTPLTWHIFSYLRSLVGPLLHWRSPRPQPACKIAPTSRSRPALACVMGDMDLLRPIAVAGIPCAVVARPGVPSLYSRFAQLRLCWKDCSQDAEALIEMLVRFGTTQSEPPVLFYEEDAQLLVVSRFRERLRQAFRFVIADAPLVEDLVDKARFQALAERHGLPVPPARRLHPAELPPADVGLRFPIIIKPLTRLERWNESLGLRKAIAVEDLAAWRSVWPQLREVGIDLLAQELIPGAEAQIESYHCYVDRGGSIAGEFTGRKIRTFPTAYGHTSALEITDEADVQRQGRAIVERLGLTGVAKLEFKRDRERNLHLLEINPRFTLWHHAGALAGVNIPALVFADLVGMPRPPVARAKAGVRWCRVWPDFPAARSAGVPLRRWLAFIIRCEAKSSLSWDDPIPLVRAMLHRLIARYFSRASRRACHARNGINS
jgi:D-aspartate ligase